MQAGDRRRGVGALAVSLALHAGAVMILLRSGARRVTAPPPPSTPVEIALVEWPPAPPPTLPAPARPGPPEGSRPPARAPVGDRGSVRSRVPGGRGEAPAPPPEAPRREPAPPSGPPIERGSDAWREAEGLGPGAPREVRPGLVAGGGLPVGEWREGGQRAATASDGAGRMPAGEAGAAAPGAPAARAAGAKARLDGYLQEVLAADRATSFPDAYWMRLAGQLEDGLSADWSLLARGSPDDAVVSGSRAGQALAAWTRAAAAFGRTGQISEGTARARPPGQGAGLPALRPHAERSLFVTEVMTEVELEQAPDGAIVAWRVVRPSSNPAHDALVLARVAALADEERRRGSLGPAPAQGRRTTWAVRTRFEMVPPVPVVGCSFDATFRPTGCFYPLKRTVKTRVRLERVWSE